MDMGRMNSVTQLGYDSSDTMPELAINYPYPYPTPLTPSPDDALVVPGVPVQLRSGRSK